jgi:hypothetical protein
MLVTQAEERYHVNLTFLNGVDELVRATMARSNQPLDASLSGLAMNFTERLQELEVATSTVREWQSIVMSLTGL